jgi:hypothetical protein
MAADTQAGTYRVEVRRNGVFIVCKRGAVAEMSAGSQATRESDAARIVALLNSQP